jgi:hypothetical protein
MDFVASGGGEIVGTAKIGEGESGGSDAVFLV